MSESGSQQAPPDLDAVQRWMLSVITHPDGVAAGIESPAAVQQIAVDSQHVDRVITRSKKLSSIERLQIYANAYYARLIECLQNDFPALEHALGEETFCGFAFGYLQAYPSRNYTLSELGNNFAKYLRETRPEDIPTDTAAWPDFLIDLAELERTYAEVFDGPGEEGQPLLEADSLLAIPQDRWPDVRLHFVPSFRLVSFRFPVHVYATSVRLEEGPEMPAPQPTWLAIKRRDYVVKRYSLTEPQFILLTHLYSGLALGEAIGRTVDKTNVELEYLAAELGNWFRDWTEAQFFQSAATEEYESLSV